MYINELSQIKSRENPLYKFRRMVLCVNDFKQETATIFFTYLPKQFYKIKIQDIISINIFDPYVSPVCQL
jgi:hypothetical protein